jgi:hypothetical protein
VPIDRTFLAELNYLTMCGNRERSGPGNIDTTIKPMLWDIGHIENHVFGVGYVSSTQPEDTAVPMSRFFLEISFLDWAISHGHSDEKVTDENARYKPKLPIMN